MAHPTILSIRTCLALGVILGSLGLVRSVPTPQALVITQTVLTRERYALSAHQSTGARNCGPGQQISVGWSIETEQFWARQLPPLSPGTSRPINTVGGFFQRNPGQVFVPNDGVYLLSMSARCETSACDVTMRLNGVTQICGMGTDILERVGGDDTSNYGFKWQTTSCATIEYLTQSQLIGMYMESGQSNDCTFETTFSYNHLNMLLLMPNTGVPVLMPGPFA